MALFNLKNSILALSYATFTSDVQPIEAMSLLQMKKRDSVDSEDSREEHKHSHASRQVMRNYPHAYGRGGNGLNLMTSGHPNRLQGRNADAVFSDPNSFARMSTTAQNGAAQRTNTGAFVGHTNMAYQQPRRAVAAPLTGDDLVNDLTNAEFEDKSRANLKFRDFNGTGYVNIIDQTEAQRAQQRAAQRMNQMTNGQRQEGVQYEQFADDDIIGGACHKKCKYNKNHPTFNKCAAKGEDCTACVVVEGGFFNTKKCKSTYN
jgi:hypothetical protein